MGTTKTYRLDSLGSGAWDVLVDGAEVALVMKRDDGMWKAQRYKVPGGRARESVGVFETRRAAIEEVIART